MNFYESIKIAGNAIRANKMRSLLTMLGIIIGIASVISVIAIGNAGQSAINAEFEMFGVDRMMIYHNWNDTMLSRDYITFDDIETMKTVFSKEIKAISPSLDERFTVSQKTVLKKQQALAVSAKGVNEDYHHIEKIELAYGRFMRSIDVKEHKNVVVIGDKLANEVFGKSDVVGEQITFNYNGQNLVFTIIGVQVPPKNSILSGFNQGHSVYVPYTVIKRLTNASDIVYFSEFSVFPEVNKADIQERIPQWLAQKHETKPSTYTVYSAESEMSMINNVTGMITAVISAIAAISLLVGGIGVMNIMLVSVTERTREIGIRKALGARRKDILSQFLVESVIISLIGGVIGTIIGAGIASLVASYLKMPPIVPLNAVAIAWAFSAGVGIFFGIYPANKAAKLDPIEALRYE